MTGRLVQAPRASLVLPKQPRTTFDEGGLQSLADSIDRNGLQHPPTGYELDGRYHVTSGERRVRALTLLGHDTIPIYLVDPPENDAELITSQLICNLQRVDLNPIDRANGIRELMESAGTTADATAKLLGISASGVSRSLKLLTLPVPLQEHVASGTIPPDVGYKLACIADDTEQARLAEEVLGNRLTRDALTRKLKRVRRQQEATRGTRVTAAIGSGQTITFVGGDLTLDTVTDWLEQLLTKARKAKAQGLTLQTFVSALRDQAKAAGKSGGNA